MHLNQIVAAITTQMMGAGGIIIRRAGAQIIIENTLSEIIGTSGGLNIRTVETLPALPTTNPGRIVHWTAEGDGTGNGAWWFATPEFSEWYPLGMFTDKSGAPPS
jgi:hypothetical protein